MRPGVVRDGHALHQLYRDHADDPPHLSWFERCLVIGLLMALLFGVLLVLAIIGTIVWLILTVVRGGG